MRRNLLTVIITLAFTSSVWAQGWTVSGGGDVTLSGSAALFPRGQDNRPSIGNQQDTDTGIRFPALGQMSFIVDGTREVLFTSSGFLVNTDYFNFGSTAGTTGYGIRDNAGTIEYKNSGGSWGTVPTVAQTNTWTGVQTFSLAPVFSSGTANRVLALDASKALVTSFVSADLLGSLSDETGTGVAVFGTSPTIAAPVFSGTTTGTYTLGGTPTLPLISSTNYPATTSAQLAGVISNETGTGLLVYATDPVLTTPNLGTPSAAVLTSATGLPLTTGVTGTLPFGNGGTGLASAADDTVPVSSGSAWVASALANCVDTGGNHLNYTASTNAFSCGTSGASSANLDTVQGRLTLTSATPVTSSDVTAATTLYWALYRGNQLALYSGSAWVTVTMTELSITLVGLTASKPYDVFIDYTAGSPALEVVVWTNDTTRATALATQDGVYVQTGDADSRYVGTIYIDSGGGAATDSLIMRNVWNYYHRMARAMRKLTATTTWVYNTASFRQAEASAANQLEFVVGVAEVELNVGVSAQAINSMGAVNISVAIGIDSTTTPATGCLMQVNGASVTNYNPVSASLQTIPTEGRHLAVWLEYGVNTGNTTWAGTGGTSYIQAGIDGSLSGG